MIPQFTSAVEQERYTMKAALVECRKRLEQYRREGDELAADIAESDMNVMLERLAAIGTGDTEATEAT